MVTIVATDMETFGPLDVSDAKVKQAREEVLLRAEIDHGSAEDFLVIMDGMGSISIGFSLLRMLVEADTPRRVALFGATPDISRLVDAWERSRLDELKLTGRLTVVSELGPDELLSRGLEWIASGGPGPRSS